MPAKKIVAIHQPNFFPWLGYFSKMVLADVFIIMDNVQFPKTGGTWINRVQLLVNGQPHWVTVPVVRAYHGVRRICEMEINNSTNWSEKLLATIRVNYARTPFYNEVFSILPELINNPHKLLADYNIHIIHAIANSLDINPGKLIPSSTLEANGDATDLLIEMVKAVGGTAYLCGGGSAGYLEEEKFTQAMIELIYQDFTHPIYPQGNTSTFISGLSIIDALMNNGFMRTRDLLIKG